MTELTMAELQEVIDWMDYAVDDHDYEEGDEELSLRMRVLQKLIFIRLERLWKEGALAMPKGRFVQHSLVEGLMYYVENIDKIDTPLLYELETIFGNESVDYMQDYINAHRE